MSLNNTDFVRFCKEAAKRKTVYMWGTFGNPVTESLIQSKRKQYGILKYSNARIETLRKYIGSRRGCDCCGLIKWYLMTGGDIAKNPIYNSAYDLNASGFYNKAKEKGVISTLPEIAGLAVYKKGHIGVYIGGGKVIECTKSSRGDGVVYSDLKAYGWTHWLKIHAISYPVTEAAKKKTVEEIAREVISGKWGVGNARKTALTAKGYNYTEVQKKVNELLKKDAQKSITEIAKEVIAGKWSVGAERKKKLTAAGYDPAAVQKEVNRLLK